MRLVITKPGRFALCSAIASLSLGVLVGTVAQSCDDNPRHPLPQLDTGVGYEAARATSNQDPPRRGDERRG